MLFEWRGLRQHQLQGLFWTNSQYWFYNRTIFTGFNGFIDLVEIEIFNQFLKRKLASNMVLSDLAAVLIYGCR